MGITYSWENGERVPSHDPRYEGEENTIDSPALVMMRAFIGFLLDCPDKELSTECLSLVSGVGYKGKSMADIARDHKVTRATVSRRCVDLCKMFGISPTRAMRNPSGQVNCRNARAKFLLKLVKDEIQ